MLNIGLNNFVLPFVIQYEYQYVQTLERVLDDLQVNWGIDPVR